MYVIKRNKDGAFVAPGGRKSSYTYDLRQALKFGTHAEAERNKCGNERAVPLEDAARSEP